MHTTENIDMMHEIEVISGFENRGPTKSGEREAAAYIKNRMEEIGLETSIEGYRINPHYYWVYFAHVSLALLAGIASLWTRPVWIPLLSTGVLLLVALSFWGDLTTSFHLIRNVILRFPSQNVVGRIARPGSSKHIVVLAHYDAAKVGSHVFNPDLDEKISRFFKEKFDSTPNVMMPIIIAMLGLAGVSIARAIVSGGTGMWISTWIVQGLSSIVLLTAALAFLDIGTGHYVTGATDNLTGVAACMSIADSVVREPLENSDFTFLASGCEEAIMMGLVQYFKRHGRHMDPENTYFINMESIGNGTVCYGVSEGFVRVRPYSRELIEIARRLKENGEFPEIGTYEVRLGTDAMVPVVRGYKSITLIAVNENNFVPNYHTDQDVPENVEIRVTERARDLALRMVRELDAS